MSHGIDSLTELTLDAALQVDETCDRFESEFRAGTQPRIEDFLADQVEPLRSSLLIELIKLEAQLRSKLSSDQTLAIEEYRARFPAFQPIVDQVLKELTEPPPESSRRFVPPAEELVLPFQLGAYRLEARIGQGGMGTVYRAMHQALDRKVALKLMPRERMRNPDAVARFQREMKAVARLHHPGIVMAYDAGEVEGTHFLVMEHVAGWDLASISRCFGPLPIPVACECVRQVAIGLQHVYEHGLVHRDIKPSNLMLTPDGQVKLLDLGLARLRENEPDELLTNDTMPMGTVEYMAPEQARNPHQVDIRADLYSLGCTLFKLLCGFSPFANIPRTTIQLLTAHLESSPPDARDCRGEVPDALAELIGRLVRKLPADRPQIPQEVEHIVARFASDSDLKAFARTARDIADSNGKLPVMGLEPLPPDRDRSQPVEGAAPLAAEVTQDNDVAEGETSQLSTSPATPRRTWIICLALATILVALSVLPTYRPGKRAIPLLRSIKPSDALAGDWRVESSEVVAPADGNGCLRLTTLTEADYELDLSVSAVEGSLRWMIVSTAEPQYSIQFRPDLVVVNAPESAGDQTLVPPNWRGDWGDFSDSSERKFRVIVRNSHLTLQRDTDIIRDESLVAGPLNGPLPPEATTVPGLYLLTEHSSLRFRNVRLLQLNK